MTDRNGARGVCFVSAFTNSVSKLFPVFAVSIKDEKDELMESFAGDANGL